MEFPGLSRTLLSPMGRERECAEIGLLLAGARSGESGTLIVRGEAGIGKTTLLEHAAAQAEEMQVLRTTGVEAESDLAFAGLYGLLRPILGFLSELPETQSAALSGALGLARSSGADRFLVSVAVLGLLAAAAEDRPVVCLVDDAQWLDAPSADALVFAARRLRADPVAMVFAAREGEESRFDAPGLPELALGGLDPQSAQALLAEHAPHAAPAVKEHLLAEAEGNPLALTELPRSLSDPQLAGTEPLPEATPLTPRLRRMFAQRIERLPAQTQTLLLIAAEEDTGDIATVLRAAEELSLSSDALEPAEQIGLIRAEGGAVTFRHPLVRSELHAGATATQRQRVHAALAQALSGEEHADRRVWHQAMATLVPDEEVAAALAASARRAKIRTAHASAAAAYLRAAELSTDQSRRSTRIADAAESWWDAGSPDRARTALGQVLPEAQGELRARLLALSGTIEARSGSLRDARSTLLAAADATQDASLKLEMLAEAAEAASYAGEFGELRALAARAAGVPARSELDRFNSLVLLGFAALYSGDHRQAESLFGDALERVDELEDPAALIWASNAASAAGGWGAGLPYANKAVALARDRGLLSLLPRALERQGGELLWNSKFDLALAAAEEAYSLSSDMGFVSPWNLMTIAAVEANRGHEDDAVRHAEQVLAISGPELGPFLAASARFTLAFVELVAGRWDQATDRLLAISGSGAHPITARAALPDLVEAAVRADRAEEVAEPLERFRAWVSATPNDVGRALLARSEALLGVRSGDEGFSEAIELEAALSPLQRARTRLLYGEWLRRERRRVDARVHLRAALDLFCQLGAAPWEQRSASELRATGETARTRDPSTLDDLTPQELQIARLVTEGLTNRQIAAQLYLSPRTIDYHLRKVFSKLGITSRTELVRHPTLVLRRPE